VVLRERAEAMLLHQFDDEENGLELQTFRWLARNGRGPAVLRLCRAVALGLADDHPKTLKPGKEDRFLALTALLAVAHDEERAELEDKVRAAFAQEDVGREMFLARAAIPTEANKKDYFEAYLRLDTPPEQWAQDSLSNFHWPAQGGLTSPFLRRALESAAWTKKHRRIFFMPAWLDAFVNGHSDQEALEVVDEFLATAALDSDVRKKLLQSRDGLVRAVRVRARFAAAK
jgi:aminopeptidase N